MPIAGDGEPPEAGIPRRRLLAVLGAGGTALLGITGCVPAQQSAPGAEAPLSNPQLEQLLAPIALYPDALLAQVLIAATYPLEIVQAQRWLASGSNARLNGAALEQALDRESWDISVKSLVPFPDVLNRMGDNLDWTQRVGDAVLGQPDAVLAAVQSLRSRAQAHGTLKGSTQQTVSGAPGSVVIEPAQPSVVYVPIYDPLVVYGAWPYPAYPPYYWPYGGALAAGIIFAAGIVIVAGFWGWARPGWGGGDINIDIDRIRNVDRDRFQQAGGRWEHDGRHRQGVAYRDQAARERYQGGSGQGAAAAREQFRGRAQQQPAGSGAGQGGLNGIGQGGDVRAASDRGRTSRASPVGGGRAPGGFGGGGARGGGGGRGGRR